jgi:flagella basal body P-ring formation protein FlgA
MTRSLPAFVLLSSTAFAACYPIAGDRILGSDLAAASPGFSSLPATMTIGYAPAPGTQRIFAAPELARIARANHLTLTNPVEVCFEIPMRLMTADETMASMRAALPPDTELAIVELPTTSIPAGRLEFPLAGLEHSGPTTHGSRVWHGSARYGETLRMPIWARVTVQRKYVAVVAIKDLALNVPVELASLRLEPVSVPLDSERVALRLEDVLGRIPQKPVYAGETIPLAILNTPPIVRRGDAVKVEVRSGSARLQFDAVAQGSARAGDLIELRNPESGRIFRARLEERGRAVVIVAPLTYSVPSRQTL